MTRPAEPKEKPWRKKPFWMRRYEDDLRRDDSLHSPVRTLEDMSEDEITAIEEQYGCKVNRKKKAL